MAKHGMKCVHSKFCEASPIIMLQIKYMNNENLLFYTLLYSRTSVS